MSWQGSAEYYRLINEFTAERLGGLHSADCLLRPVGFDPVAVRLQAFDAGKVAIRSVSSHFTAIRYRWTGVPAGTESSPFIVSSSSPIQLRTRPAQSRG